MYASLYHSHIPKLVDLDVITFDSESETIQPGPNAPQVLAALEGVGDNLDSRQETHAQQAYDPDTDDTS